MPRIHRATATLLLAVPVLFLFSLADLASAQKEEKKPEEKKKKKTTEVWSNPEDPNLPAAYRVKSIQAFLDSSKWTIAFICVRLASRGIRGTCGYPPSHYRFLRW